MVHWSPQVALVHAVYDTWLLLFVALWVWHVDRFKSLMVWKRDNTSSVFKRIMMACFILGTLIYGVQGILFAIIKYNVGWVPVDYPVPELASQPMYYLLWPKKYQDWIDTCLWLEALGWSGEIIAHNEESLYWIWLINLTPTSPTWFKSWYFRAVIVSTIATLALFLGITAAYLKEPLRHSTVLGITFSICMWLQNLNFMETLAENGANAKLLRRFVNFHLLNRIRVTARWAFVIPFTALCIDGFTKNRPLNTRPWVVDLVIIGGYGCYIASAVLTLIIFVPLPPSKFERSEWFEKREAQDSVNLDFSYARRMSGSGGGVISLGYSSSSGTQSLGSSGGSDGVTNVVNPLSSVQQRRTAHRMPGFGQSDLPAIHPDVLGYSSPIDIPDWQGNVAKSTTISSFPLTTLSTTGEDPEEALASSINLDTKRIGRSDSQASG